MFAASAPVARVVLTHSTYMHGLVARLARLAAHPDVATVVPGRMATTRSSTERMEIRVTIPVPGGARLRVAAPSIAVAAGVRPGVRLCLFFLAAST